MSRTGNVGSKTCAFQHVSALDMRILEHVAFSMLWFGTSLYPLHKNCKTEPFFQNNFKSCNRLHDRKFFPDFMFM